MNEDKHAVQPDEALAVLDDNEVVMVEEDETDGADPAVCLRCRGPVRICGGVQRCTSGHLDPLERRWITAIRLVYAGLCLTPTAAALWGGALLRLATLLTRGMSVSPSFTEIAAAPTDPGAALPADVAAGLAVTYLHERDVDRLEVLFRALRSADAPWLAEIRILGPRAALATPLEHARFALFAVPCEACARAAPMDALFTHAGTYDAAIHCPRCGEIAAHPLPVRIGAPHPVGRCAGTGTCRAHPGHTLDASGLCIEGRATLARAQREAEKIGHAVTPRDRALLDALERTQDVAPLPFVATIAALNPRTARDLAQIPDFGNLLRLGAEFVEVFTSGLDRVFDASKAQLQPGSASRRQRRGRRKGTKR